MGIGPGKYNPFRPIRSKRITPFENRLLAIVFILFLLVGIIIRAQQQHFITLLKTEGKQTIAMVDKKDSHWQGGGMVLGGGWGWTSYDITYHSNFSGRTYVTTEDYPLEEWNKLKSGDSISITYLPNNYSHQLLTYNVEHFRFFTLSHPSLRPLWFLLGMVVIYKTYSLISRRYKKTRHKHPKNKA